MPDNGKPATGPLILQHVIQTESTIADLLKLFEAHAGAAVEHRKTELKAIEDLHKDYHYYGDQLIKVYHDLNKNIKRLNEQLDLVLRAEREKAA
jgi:hypothetical protein